MTEPLALAAGFPTPSREAWEALVAKTLNGAGPEALRSVTRDGLVIEPLYRNGPEIAVRPPQGPTDRPWDIRCATRHPDPGQANRDIISDLEGGAASALVRIDPEGLSGVAIGDQGGLAGVLSGVALELAPVALDAGYLGPQSAEWLAGLAKGAPAAELYFHLDPLTQFAQAGSSPGPIESHILHAATTAVRLARAHPRAGLFLAAGRAVHEAGGTEVQELAFAMASALTYVRALEQAGLGLDQAFAGVVIGLSAGADYFPTIAKLRAARLVWAKIASAFGVDAGQPARIEVRSSLRMLTRLDPWTNLPRLACAGFAAAVGGADAIVLSSFTEPLGLPSPLARRQARNIQLVLMEEAHLGRVADPAGGAWFVESLTDQVARAAWAALQSIEGQGGLVAALKAGTVQAEVDRAAQAQVASLRDGRDQILGVTCFRDSGSPGLEVERGTGPALAVKAPDPRKPGPDSVCAPLSPHRLAEAFEEAGP